MKFSFYFLSFFFVISFYRGKLLKVTPFSDCSPIHPFKKIEFVLSSASELKVFFLNESF